VRILVFNTAIHHNPAHWDAPETFDPSRFGDDKAAGIVPFSFLPFGAGRRFCIGAT
jgi:cytochrome P450